jgi:hypothetical protein
MNQPAIDEETGEQIVRNDITKANHDVDVDVGPSSSSRRAAAVRALTGMMSLTQDPQTQQILSAMAMMNMEGEGISDARDYFRKLLVQQGVMKPTKEEADAMQRAQAQADQKPDPQAQYLQAAAEQAQGDAALARAKTVDTVAAAGLKHAQTQKTLAEIPDMRHARAVDAFKAMTDAATPPAGMGL